jgi:hypothetical protein
MRLHSSLVTSRRSLCAHLNHRNEHLNLNFKFLSVFSVHPTIAENPGKLSEAVQMSLVLLARSTKMLHLQRDASPKDDKRFNLLLAMSGRRMSNNLLRAVLAGDGAKMPGV